MSYTKQSKLWSMTRPFIQVLMLLAVASPAAGQLKTSCDISGPHTIYSRHASVIEKGDIRSPDGGKTVKVTPIAEPPKNSEGQLRFTVTAGSTRHEAVLEGFDAEVSWSPDSSAFAVTETEGGGGIGPRVYVFYVEPNELRKLTVSTPVEKDFGSPTKCEVPVPPNTGFVTWLGGSDRVLIAAQVVPVSICRCSGMFRAYEVHLPDLKIIGKFDQSTAKQKFWTVLGCELRDAESCPAGSSR
jgi:hypothetical protein